MKRWLIAMLGLALAAGALVALVSGRGSGGATHEQGPPHGEIDDASRAELERVLREAAHENGSSERRK